MIYFKMSDACEQKNNLFEYVLHYALVITYRRFRRNRWR